MRILVLSSQAVNTGSTLRAAYLARYLSAAGADVTYIPPPLKSMPFMLDFALSFFYYFFALLNRKCDAVIIVKPYPNTVLPAMMLKAAGARIVIDIDDLDHGYRRGILSAFIAWLQGKLVQTADLLTTHNRELEKLILKDHPGYRGRIYYLKQCVDFGLFTGGYAKRAGKIRRENDGLKLLFYMAHLNVAAYLDPILSTVGMIKEHDVKLIVSGGGPMEGYYRDRVRKLGLENRVAFTGQVTQQEAAAYACAADICLVYYEDRPVNRYRASMKLREYLALGRPVVATAVGEIRDFNRYITPCVPKPASFAGAIEKALRAGGSNGRAKAFIKKEYNWRTEAVRFYKYLKSLGW